MAITNANGTLADGLTPGDLLTVSGAVAIAAVAVTVTKVLRALIPWLARYDEMRMSATVVILAYIGAAFTATWNPATDWPSFGISLFAALATVLGIPTLNRLADDNARRRGGATE